MTTTSFTLFDTNSGQVLFGGSASDPQALAQEGQSLLVGQVFEDGYIQNGEHFPLPAQPSPHRVFDYSTKQWVDPRTLSDMKALKNEAINRARAAANSSTFTFEGKQIAVDALSRSDIDATHGAILMLGTLPPDWPGAWKAVDNTYVPIPDVATWAQFYGAMVATGAANFSHAQGLKAQLQAATDIAQVEAVPNW